MNVSSGTSSLFWIIKNGSKTEILRILQEETEIDLISIDKDGKTVLTLTFENKNLMEEDVIDILEYFLDRGVDPNIENEFGKTALLEAAASSKKVVVDLFIRRQANVNRTYSDGDTITHRLIEDLKVKYCSALAIMSDADLKTMVEESASYVEWLIAKGFDFDRRNHDGESALSLSLNYGLQHIALVILEHTEQINVTYNYNRNLLHKLFDFSEVGKLREYNHSKYASKIVEILLNKGLSAVDMSDERTAPLWMAIVRGEGLDIIDMLLDRLVWSNDVATTVLLELFNGCRWWGDESRTDYFLKIARTSIAKGADVNAIDTWGEMAVYYAFQGRNRRATEFLDENGADFSLHYYYDGNLFHVLAYTEGPGDKGPQEALFDLLASKACCDVNARGYCAKTPLHRAAEVLNLTIARKLIQHGADVNAKDSDGSTALHHAFNSRQYNDGESLIELLLTNGAEVNCKNRKGQRPFACVNILTSRRSVSLLLKWGALVNDYHDGKPIFCNEVFLANRQKRDEMFAYGLDINDSRICEFLCSELESDFHRGLVEKFLPRHCIKHDVAKLPCSDYYKKYTSRFIVDEKYVERCTREVAKLESSFIDSQTSLYDYLHMDVDSRVLHNNNEKLKNLVDRPDLLEQQFSEYSVLILARYRTAVRWKSLLGPAKEAWLRLTHIALPEVCIEIIFAHLRIEDLVVFIEGV